MQFLSSDWWIQSFIGVIVSGWRCNDSLFAGVLAGDVKTDRPTAAAVHKSSAEIVIVLVYIINIRDSQTGERCVVFWTYTRIEWRSRVLSGRRLIKS